MPAADTPAATVPERVARGVEFLDRVRPGWFGEVDAGRLDMSSTCRCVLGQLWGLYTLGLDRARLPRHRAAEHGFIAESGWPASQAESQAITAEWVRVIRSRRKQRKEVKP